MDLSKYRRLFLEECREHLQVLNRELLRVERESAAGAGVDAMFRAAHSIKGMSGSMGYESLVALSHAFEDVMDLLRRRALAVTPELMSLLFQGVDTLGLLANEVEESGEPAFDPGGVVAALRACASGGAPPPATDPRGPDAGPSPPAPPAGAALPDEAALPGPEDAAAPAPLPLTPEQAAAVREAVQGGQTAYQCRLRVAKDSPALAARNFVILGRLGQSGRLVAASPSLEEVRAGRSRDAVTALVLTGLTEEQLRARLLGIPELLELELRPLRLGGQGAAEGLVPGEARVERPPAAAPSLADRYAPRRASTVRVDTRVLDDLINLVGELILTRDRLLELGRGAGEELQADLGRLNSLIREFQERMMTVRMMPLELVTDRLPRVVRDLAHQGGKQVAFDVAGKGIELDRAILEELNDVLIHIVRNAIDHGVEPPQERAAAGKPARGSLSLRAGRERDWVWIRVEDDGRGMDPDRLAAAAVARGAISAEKAASLEPREKLQLCCLPGVSTAERVTDVSGRGVGMDVVKARVDAFGGRLRIESAPGRGTAISLRLPLTLAIVRILLVEAGGARFGLPVSHVARALPLGPGMTEWSQRRPLLRWGERLIPLRDLGEVLGQAPRDLRREPGGFAVVAESGGAAAAVAVERLLGTMEAVVKPLGPPLKRVRGLAGVTILGDGRTVLLLDVPALL